MSDKLTPAEREFLRRSCKASGVPEKITDPATIRLLVSLLTSGRPR